MEIPIRKKLPDDRGAITHKFDIAGYEGYITVGLFEDGMPGEIFLVMARESSTISGFADAFARAISCLLQYGVPLQVLVDNFSDMRFEPSGDTKNPDVRFAKSIVDYIFRWMATKFLTLEGKAKMERLALKTKLEENRPSLSPFPLTTLEGYQEDAPPCSICGSTMVRRGSCWRCSNCGNTEGCFS